MFLKRIFVVVFCALIAIGGVIYGSTFRFFDRPLTGSKQEKFQQTIRLPDNFTLAASVNSFDTVKNTLQSARKNVSDGSYALELNVTFDEDGTTLYLADGPEYITESSVKLETIFKEFQDSTYLRYILRLMNKTTKSTLIDLAMKYGLFGRIMLIGFSTQELVDSAGQYGNFHVCVRIDPSRVKLSDYDACCEELRLCLDNGASGISCRQNEVTDEFRQALYDVGELRLVFEDVNSNYEMYEALSMNPNVIITAHPEILYNMMLEQDYLNQNKSNLF
jgi:hypothetical protein